MQIILLAKYILNLKNNFHWEYANEDLQYRIQLLFFERSCCRSGKKVKEKKERKNERKKERKREREGGEREGGRN